MIYSAIFENFTILADYSEEGGDFAAVLTKLYKANRQSIEFYTVTYLGYDCFFLHENNFTFSCMVNQNSDGERVLVFLQTLKENFFKVCRGEKDNMLLKTTYMIREVMV
jgi:hypothetical protein